MTRILSEMPRRRGWLVSGFLLCVLLFPGCKTEEIILERPRWDDPPAEASGFLGYLSSEPTDQGLPVCGECHVSKRSAWALTAHAEAWDELQESGNAQEFCEGCHTTNARGSTSTVEGGWLTTGDPRYHNVQCESCHGPGETHAGDPTRNNIPLASLAVGLDLESGCGECHAGAHRPIVEQWSESPHAHVVEGPSSREACFPCHRGQGTLLAWGENANYVEKFSEEPLPVVCGVCHDPHGEAMNDGQLRFPVHTTSSETHICSRCHNRRPNPEGETSRGPHAPESALLEGQAGWFPPGLDVDPGQIIATHGSGSNDRWCATCHVWEYDVEDEYIGGELEIVGHSFNPIPCVDADGQPLPFPNECGLSADERFYVGCVDSGCHSSEQSAASALTAASTRMAFLAGQLQALLDQLPEGEVSRDPPYTVGDGADFNLQLAYHGNEEFGTNTVLGSSVHNPFLMEALLIASIQAVEDEYGAILPRVSGTDWDAELKAVLERAPVR